MGRKTSQQRTTLIVLAVVGAGLLLSAAAAGTFLVAVRSAPAKKTYEREDLRTLVTGKTEQEVIDLLGRPESTVRIGERPIWTYVGVSHDRVTGHIDREVAVQFERGRVVHVSFY